MDDEEAPAAPYPLFARGEVVKGFGRGSKQLGIPTANFNEEIANTITQSIPVAIYYGWAALHNSSQVYPMVMSVGWNPYYNNQKKTAEVHIMHSFDQDFYGQELRIVVLGYIRDEKNYTSVDALIQDINNDIKIAHNSLAKPAYKAYQTHRYLTDSKE